LFLGPSQVHSLNGISIGSATFAGLTAERPCTLQWAGPFPQNCPFHWGSGAPSNTWFLEPTRAQPKRHLDRFSSFCRAQDCACDRQTDHVTRSVTVGRIYVRYYVLRCGLVIKAAICNPTTANCRFIVAANTHALFLECVNEHHLLAAKSRSLYSLICL